MTLRLPVVSDTLRHEARVIQEAAERTAKHMMLCHDAARDAHKIVKAAERLVERAESVIRTDAVGNRFQSVFAVDLAELKLALGNGEEPKR